ncbi:fumarylacetoacetase [Chryseolinea sp. T2]|uniref:fumarylacetoacetase n=1 Tax=Chryseolinea sp. T2 TaxID=3129255 RepID=UPI0030778400
MPGRVDITSVGQRTSWIDVPRDCDFTIFNIPFGVFRAQDGTSKCCSAIGNFVIDLSVISGAGYFDEAGIPKEVFGSGTLNNLIALGKERTNKIRTRLIELLSEDNVELKSRQDIVSKALIPMQTVSMQMPLTIGDYTDFYSSKEHASNIGSLLRDPNNPLLPNWRHLPVAYHGRVSSIVISGTPVIRPSGQFKRLPTDSSPVFGPTERLDYELEMAFVIGRNSDVGEPIPIGKAEEYIFGFLLFNDWSARDIQSWEYAPLGPFLSKNFMSSVSPWIVTTEAMAPFRVRGPEPEVQLLPYLQTEGELNYDIRLDVELRTGQGASRHLSTGNFRHMYWNSAQQLAHHTITGCNVRIGDLMASGTISGPEENASGCLMELTRNGQTPIQLHDGSIRTFLLDGDTVIMRAHGQKEHIRVGFGEVTGTVSAFR